MTNWDKYKEDIEKVLLNTGDHFAVTHDKRIVACSQTFCSDCIFAKSNSCRGARKKWLLTKIEKELTEAQKRFVRVLYDSGWNYIARDASGICCAYHCEPTKNLTVWTANSGDYFIVDNFGSLTDFVSWNDEKTFRYC